MLTCGIIYEQIQSCSSSISLEIYVGQMLRASARGRWKKIRMIKRKKKKPKENGARVNRHHLLLLLHNLTPAVKRLLLKRMFSTRKKKKWTPPAPSDSTSSQANTFTPASMHTLITQLIINRRSGPLLLSLHMRERPVCPPPTPRTC